MTPFQAFLLMLLCVASASISFPPKQWGTPTSRRLLHQRKLPRGGSDGYSEDGLCDLPDQVNEKSIQLLVKEILKDQNTNIRLLPDKIEAELYRNIVRLTLNAFYQVIKSTDGKPLLMDHQLKLRHYPDSLSKTEAFASATTSHVNIKVLEEVADRLLKNKNINQPLIPDILERHIYVNCLKVVFRTLDIFQSSLRVNLCGHSLGLFLTNSTQPIELPSVASVKRATSILSNVSAEELLQYQQDAGLRDHHRSGLFSFWGNQRREWLSQVHATMFGLVVQIVQDMLDQSEIELVGVGTIVMDLVPVSSSQKNTTKDKRVQVSPPLPKPSNSVATFVSGMGLGAVLVLLLLNNIGDTDGLLDIDKWLKETGSLLRGSTCRLKAFLKSTTGSVLSRIRNGDRDEETQDSDNEEDADAKPKGFQLPWGSKQTEKGD
jgi:hypothetical protein